MPIPQTAHYMSCPLPVFYSNLIVCRHLPPAKVLGLVLAVSLVWHSVLLYKDAVATQQVRLNISTCIINISTYQYYQCINISTPGEADGGHAARVPARGDVRAAVRQVLRQPGLQQRGQVCRVPEGRACVLCYLSK